MTVRLPVSRSFRHRLAGERGSLLLTAMLFAIGIAIVLGSYLALGRTALKVAHRTYFAHDAANLAEAGLEEALYCFNLMNAGTATATAWTGWTLSGADAMRTLPPFNRDQNGIGIVKVYVIGYDGSNATPTILSQAAISPFDGGAPIVKTVQATLQNNGAPGYGLVALNGLDLNNSSFVDSFNSNPSNSPTGPWAAYSGTNAQANASVVVLAGSISIGRGRIRGNLHLGPGVTAPPASEVTGTITTNVSATFPFPAYPTAAGVSQSYDVGSSIPGTLPGTTDQPAADGRYYYFCRNATIRNFTVRANCDITIVGTSTSMTSGITLPASSTLHVYMDRALTLSSGADLNATGWAGALRIYTTTGNQCSIGNNSRLVAMFHAPNAALRATGSNSSNMLVGYFLADTIYASGSMDFHYDESLRPPGAGRGWKPTGWLELHSAADRAAVAGRTNNYLR